MLEDYFAVYFSRKAVPGGLHRPARDHYPSCSGRDPGSASDPHLQCLPGGLYQEKEERGTIRDHQRCLLDLNRIWLCSVCDCVLVCDYSTHCCGIVTMCTS